VRIRAAQTILEDPKQALFALTCPACKMGTVIERRDERNREPITMVLR